MNMIVRASQEERVARNQSTSRGTVNVLHVINGEHFSGAERVQDLLALNLPDCGYAASFATLKSGRFAECRQSNNSPLYHVPMKSRLDSVCSRQIASLVREHKFALLHAHTPRSLMVAAGAARIAKVPLVYHVHSPVGRDCGNWLKNKVNTWMESRWLRQCSHMICVSGSLKQYMVSLGHPESKLSVVRNGVAIVPSNDFAEPGGIWTLGTVALFRPRKGLEVLIQSLAELRDLGCPVRLLAVGPFETPDYQREIDSLVEKLGVGNLIEWTGFETDVNRRLREMNIMVLPSLYGEGLPMVVLEAMACGVPVVASRVEGIPEAIRDGVDGVVFGPGNSHELAVQIQVITGDRAGWRQMAASARTRQRESLSDVSMARGVAGVYDLVTGRD